MRESCQLCNKWRVLSTLKEVYTPFKDAKILKLKCYQNPLKYALVTRGNENKWKWPYIERPCPTCQSCKTWKVLNSLRRKTVQLKEPTGRSKFVQYSLTDQLKWSTKRNTSIAVCSIGHTTKCIYMRVCTYSTKASNKVTIHIKRRCLL